MDPIEHMVRLFYERAFEDPVLGPIFFDEIHDLEPHILRVADFWSDHLRGTKKYEGKVYAVHMRLKFEPEAFDNWLRAFEGAANEALEAADAAKAIRIARHMAGSFKVGLFPFTGKDGRPSRTP